MCGANASARVIATGTTISAQINSAWLKEDLNNRMTIILVIKTQALPSMVLTYFLFENRAYVLYFNFPNLIPTGSARPSPMPFMRIGIKINLL